MNKHNRSTEVPAANREGSSIELTSSNTRTCHLDYMGNAAVLKTIR